MSQDKVRLSWMLWHPHQGLWNWALVRTIRRFVPIPPIHTVIIGVIILLDTFILFLRAIVRRVSLLGLTRIFAKARVPDDISVLYLDFGTHKEGAELSLMVDDFLPQVCNNFEAYGFEASQESFEQADEKFSGRENVRIIHKAVCHVLPSDGKIRLYHDLKSGLGDSLHRQTASYEEVEALRLSDFLCNVVMDNRIILLRMNVEGAEYDVIKDLVESGAAKYINGYFGMWDDVSKFDIQRDDEFRTFLLKNQIYTFTFNGRDLRVPFRRKCITYHIQTHILTSLLQLQEEPRNRQKRKV